VIIAVCGVGVLAQSVSDPPTVLFPIRTVWTLALNNQLALPPAYDAANAFFPIAGDRIVAYDLTTGTRQWMISAKPQFQPVTGDGLVIFTDGDRLTALQAGDGSIAWQLPSAEKLAVRPVWNNGWLFVAKAGGAVDGLRASDGHLVWSRAIGSPAHALPAVAADRVYIPAADGRIVALRVDTGEPQWERRLGGAPTEILALDERLYVGATDNFFYCLLTKDGRVDWRWRAGGDVIGVPVADERRVYFAALDNVLRALNRSSGGQHWMRPLPVRPSTGPVMAGRTLIVTGQAPALRGYNMDDGTPAGEVAAAPEVAAPPYVFTDNVTRLPSLVFLTKDLVKGATATLITRSLEPPVNPVAPLPNLVTVKPGAEPDR
jgi:outer membrane protein assembly factor BamB